MSEHTWTRDHIPAYLAGGLSADDAERLDGHVRDCPECAAELTAARHFDGTLTALFAPARPPLGLEDRAVRAVRTASAQSRLLSGWRGNALATAAGIGFLGTVGAAVGSIAGDGRLPLPDAIEVANAERIHREGQRQILRSAIADEVVDSSPSSASPADRIGRVRIEGNGVSQVRDAEKLVDSRGSGPGQPRSTATDGNDVLRPGFNFNGTLHGSLGGSNPGNNASIDNQFRELPSLGRLAPNDQLGKDTGKLAYYFQPNASVTDKRLPATENVSTSGPSSKILGLTDTSDRDAKLKVLEEALRKALPQPPKDSPPDSRNPGASRPAPAPPVADPEPARRVVIRSGDIEFEVESFDGSLAAVTKLVAGLKGAFVATVNSEKLPNGKVKGSVTVRTPPEHLDGLVLDLRRELGKGGELKGVRVGTQDITKQYTDLESRLRAARTMEQRLLQIIKEGKGEIKQLLEAEKELGVWRTRIEEVEGELRYYGSLVALSTLTITLAEKEIRAAASITDSERVQAGVEVEDVDQAFRQLLAAVQEAKGRVTKSELKQLAAGQFNAAVHFEVAPDAAGPLRDRLRQLGRVARLEVDRTQQAVGGTLPTDARVKRGDAVFQVQLYNLANVAPREAAVLQVAVPDVAAAYQAVRDAVAKAAGRVLVAQLNEQDRQNVTAQLDFDVKRADEGAVRAVLDAAGEVVARQVVRAAESDNVTDSKVQFRATFLSAAKLKPRELTALAVEVADVENTAAAFASYVAEAKGRTVDAKSGRERDGRATARQVFEVPLAAAAGLAERFKGAGTVRAQQTTRDPQAPDGRFATARLEVSLSNAEPIVGTDDGLWPPVRRGLSYSASVLLTSVTWVVFGLCVVLPWALVGYGGYRLVRRAAGSGPARPGEPGASAAG